MNRRLLLRWLAVTAVPALATRTTTAAPANERLLLAISAEYGHKSAFTAHSIERGVRLAVDEINAAGGVLGGRKLDVVTRDDRGVPARAIDNVTELARIPAVIAVFCGRFSPVALELLPVVNREQILLLDPWAAADGIANNGSKPNFVFRLALTDTWAIETMLDHALKGGRRRIAVFVPNTGWGRSSVAAVEAYARRNRRLLHQVVWYNFGDQDFRDRVQQAAQDGMQALLMVANEFEGAAIVNEVAALPPARQVPVIAHWGIAGGDFPQLLGNAGKAVDLVVVQTFSFAERRNPRIRAVAEAYRRKYGEPVDRLLAQVGFAHAYDLTHLLGQAIIRAGSANRKAIQAAMETLPAHDGLVRRYAPPFTPDNHEALDRREVFLARFAANGTLVPVR